MKVISDGIVDESLLDLLHLGLVLENSVIVPPVKTITQTFSQHRGARAMKITPLRFTSSL
jgi:hypothetical protein